MFIFSIALKIAGFVILPLMAVVALVYYERKILASVQLRVGPNVVGPFGILQLFADALKTVFKETIIPYRANTLLFIIAPIITFVCAIAMWAVLPISAKLYLTNINVGIIYVWIISALGVYGIILAGWSSNSKYAMLGAIRSASQMISYEISMGFAILSVIVMAQSANLIDIVDAQRDMWFCILLFPIAITFMITILAETNRHPFDLPEAESELVAGYNVEYSSTMFAIFFLAEYLNMISMSAFYSILFLGGWLPIIPIDALAFVPSYIWMIIKICFILYVFIIVRATTPRYRYDQLIYIGWQVLLPTSMICFVLSACWKFYQINYLYQ